jgi:hypothetical protein
MSCIGSVIGENGVGDGILQQGILVVTVTNGSTDEVDVAWCWRWPKPI